MSETPSIAPFRRMTPGMLVSAHLAMTPDVPDTTKGEIALLLKKAAPILGIDGTTYHVMDILLGLSRPEDWKGARRPIVSISNAKLAEYTMRSERTVIRCIRRLVEFGVAAYRDSPTGRRYSQGHHTGECSHGFGIDFTPARVRFVEIKAAVDSHHERMKREQIAKRDISRLSRAIVDIAHALGQTNIWLPRLELLHSGELDVVARAKGYLILHEEIVAHSRRLSIHDSSCEGDIHVMPYTKTDYKSESEGRGPESPDKQPVGSNAAIGPNEREALLRHEERKSTNVVGIINKTETHQTDTLANVSLGLLHVAWRETRAMTGLVFESWSSFGQSGETLRRMIGLPEAVWSQGRLKVGKLTATAILGTILEKLLRDPDLILSPVAYFQAMVRRAFDGKLNLQGSLYRLAERALQA